MHVQCPAYKEFGTIPDDNLSVAAGKLYTFIFSSWKRASSLQDDLSASLDAYASNVSVTGQGLTGITVNLIPKNTMPVYAWRNLFSESGLTDMKDMYAGGMSTPEPSPLTHPVQNITTYWEPKIESAADALKKTVSSSLDYVKWIVIGGAVIVGGVVIMTYMPRPSRTETVERVYKQNPKKKYRRAR